MRYTILRRLLWCLLLGTAAALAWHSQAPDRALVVDANSGFAMRAVDDRSSGGRSHSTLKRGNGLVVLECNIDAAYQWPYCEIGVDLGAAPQGMDLSRYDTLKLWLKSEGPEPQQQLRFFLRQFNPAYSKAGDTGSYKPLELVYEPGANPQPLVVKLTRFSVASWWSSAHPLPVQHAGLELDNVVAMDISTGGTVQPGLHRITLERIEFSGAIVSAADLRLGLIALWAAVALGWLLADALLRWRWPPRAAPGAQTQQPAGRPAVHSLSRRGGEALRLQAQPFAMQAGQDALTGTYNRAGLEQELQRLADRRGGGAAGLFPMAMVLADIDNLKQINEGFGGDAGDLVIRQTAELLRGQLPPGALVARWGGGEFLVVLTGASSEQGLALAEAVRARLAQASWAHGQPVTGSFGVAVALAGDRLADVVRRAVDAMYSAKINGRDRVELGVAARRI